MMIDHEVILFLAQKRRPSREARFISLSEFASRLTHTRIAGFGYIYFLSLPIGFSRPQLPSNKEATKQNRHRRYTRLFLVNVLDVKKCLDINFKVRHSLRENGSDLDH